MNQLFIEAVRKKLDELEQKQAITSRNDNRERYPLVTLKESARLNGMQEGILWTLDLFTKAA